MEIINHPTFDTTFKKIFWSCVFLSIFSFFAGFYVKKTNFSDFSIVFFILFILCITGGISLCFIKLNNVKCPRCGGFTKTERNIDKRLYFANCYNCSISWNLNIGISTDSDT